MAEAKNAATLNRLMSKRQSVLYFPYSTLFSRVKGHKASPVLPRLLPSIVMGSLLRRAHFKSLRTAEAKTSATINQLKYRSCSCITENIALGAWSRANKALGCASCFIGSRPHPRAIFAVKPSSQYDAEPRVTLRRMALWGVATRRVVHNFGEHARVRRTATTPIACVFGSEYTNLGYSSK